MRRDPDAIADSHERMFGKNAAQSSIREDMDRMFDIAIEKALNRRDVLSLTQIRYEDMIDEPQRELRRLIDDDWSFDVEKAAKTIDPQKCHHGRRTAVAGVA